ncbi:hypothetical protein WA026_018303 [Henosepilachna vigintioctopunctata]|uniref:lysozyme n=1 Tax=Henosepilachna vigintioctopunctata TaxID=420089 RepID=A0AAW1VI00_9CUCU
MAGLKIVLCFVILGVFSNQSVHAKVYTRCGLTKQLLDLNFSRTFIGNWVCLIESESGKDTSKVTIRANGRKGLGLFQIKSKDWCTFGKKGGLCNVKCEDMTNENIKDDAACAVKVRDELGFSAWNGWKRSCKGRKLPIPVCLSDDNNEIPK